MFENIFGGNTKDKKNIEDDEKQDHLDINSLNKSLFNALKNDNQDKAYELLDKGANPDFKFNGMTLLYATINHESIEDVEFLLKKGASITEKNEENPSSIVPKDFSEFSYNLSHRGKTPIDAALSKSNIEIIMMLLKYNPLNDELLKWISKQDFEKSKIKNIMNELYAIKINGYKDGIRFLYHEILNNNIDRIKYLLDNSVHLNLKNSDDYHDYEDFDLYYEHKNKTSLELSIDKANIEIIELLVKYNADINALLYFSIEKDKFEISELLLQKGANPNLFNSLELACINQNLKIIKLLIEYKADTNFTGDDGRTALFDAIEATKANKEIINYLIKNGADIHKEDNKGISPLSFAQTNKKSLVKVLTEHEEIILSENQDLKIHVNYQTLSDKVLLQNKVINKLKDKIQELSANKDIEQEKLLDSKFDIFKNDLLKSIEDKENSFTSKIIQLEREYRDKYKGQNIFIRALESQLETLEKKLERYKNIKTNESQTDETEAISKLTSKEKETNKLIQSLLLKVEKLEKKFNKQKIAKTKIPLDIHVENKSIKKDDGVIVKRESFDDF